MEAKFGKPRLKNKQWSRTYRCYLDLLMSKIRTFAGTEIIPSFLDDTAEQLCVCPSTPHPGKHSFCSYHPIENQNPWRNSVSYVRSEGSGRSLVLSLKSVARHVKDSDISYQKGASLMQDAYIMTLEAVFKCSISNLLWHLSTTHQNLHYHSSIFFRHSLSSVWSWYN